MSQFNSKHLLFYFLLYCLGFVNSSAQNSAIGNYVWLDDNSNGWQEAEETGLDGVRVELYLDNGDKVANPVSDTKQKFTMTSRGGNFQFSNLTKGDYFLLFFLPPNFEVTPQTQLKLNQNLNSDALPAEWQQHKVAITPVVNLDANQELNSLDLGIVQKKELAAVGNYIWFDFNKDGIQNELPEDGVNGIQIDLYSCYSNLPILTTTSHDDIFGNPGSFLFSGLIPGNYYLKLKANQSLLYSPSSTNQVNNSDLNQKGETACFTLKSGDYNQNIDLGVLRASGEINFEGQIWFDLNNNDKFEDTEQAPSNIALLLYKDVNRDSKFDLLEDQFYGKTYTFNLSSKKSTFKFNNLPEGTYFIALQKNNQTLNSFELLPKQFQKLSAIWSSVPIQLDKVNSDSKVLPVQFKIISKKSYSKQNKGI